MTASNDLSGYRPLLCRLASYSQRNDFDNIFKSILNKSGVDSNLHFILKMELNRLQKPCNRAVDLRGLVDGNCEAYSDGEITHFFDDIAKNIYEEQCENFKSYTVGVFECINNTPNNYRVMHENEKAGVKVEYSKRSKAGLSLSHKVDQVNFNNYHIRKEERMHYVSDVSIIKNKVNLHFGKTVDISVSGCQIKAVKGIAVKTGERIGLRFRKLEEEFELGLKQDLMYEILSIDSSHEEFNLIRLSRKSCEETENFDAFLGNYITGNKRRYRINLDNTIESVYSRGYCQYSLPRRTDLCLLVRDNMVSNEPFMAIATELNKDIIEYWQNNAKKLIVHNVFTEKRMEFLKAKLSRGHSDSYLYVFSGQSKNNEKVFYSAFKEELESTPSVRDLFWNIGIKKYDFKVFSVNLSNSDEDYAYQPFSLLSETIDVFKQLNKKPSPRVMRKLHGLSHVISIKDITSEEVKSDYLIDNVDIKELSKVKAFKLTKQENIQITPIRFLDVRKEDRYQIKTPVRIYQNKDLFGGRTIDLSTKGMKVKFDNPVNLEKGSVVSLDFEEFQKNNPNKKLSNLKYRVVNTNKRKDEYSFTVEGNVIEHKGRIFVRNLINKNRNYLLDYQAGTQDIELSWCIQNILASSCVDFTSYLKRQGNRLVPVKNSLNTNRRGFSSRISHENKTDLAFLFNKNVYKNFVEKGLSSSYLKNNSQKVHLYISFEKDKLISKVNTEFGSNRERLRFIKEAQEAGKFYCLSATMSKAGRPDMTRINTEINYISVYSMHKGKEIEDELWSIFSLLEFRDITEEVLYRHSVLENNRTSEKMAA